MIRKNDSILIIQAAATLKESKKDACIAKAFDLEIDLMLAKKKWPQALSLINDQETFIKKTGCSDDLLLQVYFNNADYSKATQDYEGLSKYAFLALENAEAKKDTRQILRAIRLIVFLFTRQDQQEKNWQYIKRAENLIVNQHEDYATAADYNWLAFEYENKFTIEKRITLLDSAVLFTRKAFGSALGNADYFEVTRCYRIFESNAYHRGNIQQAILFLDTALFYVVKIPTPANPASLYYAKAWDYMDLNDFKNAQRWQDTCLWYAEKFEGRTPATLALYGEAAKLYEQAGNLPKALQTLRIYEKIKDSVFKLQRLEKINELEQKYNKATNERTIRELDQQRNIYILLSLLGLLAVITIGFFFRQQSLKQKQKILETEQRLNRARMNPHFFFNSLMALQQYSLQENNAIAMAGNLSRFSYLMRETLESTYKEYITVEDEIEFLSQYLELQRQRFPSTFSFTIEASSDLEIDELQLPSMILQPFIENSIEHGLAGIDYPGKIDVYFLKEGQELVVRIADNGRGLSGGSEKKNEHISRALQIIKDRIYLLNIKHKSKASFTIDNNKEGRGVEVIIRLPLIYQLQTNKA